jgi:hypothetical protein
MNTEPRKPRRNVTDRILADPHALQRIKSCTYDNNGKYYRANKRACLQSELANLGYQINGACLDTLAKPLMVEKQEPVSEVMTPNITGKVCPKCQIEKAAKDFNKHGGHRDKLSTSCKECIKRHVQDKRAGALEASQPVRATKTLPPQKPAPQVILDAPELIVNLPGIYEVENRGRGTRSFRFESTIDG